MTGEWSGAGIVNAASELSDDVNGETGISEADAENVERGKSPHAEEGIAWPSCLTIVSLISA